MRTKPVLPESFSRKTLSDIKEWLYLGTLLPVLKDVFENNGDELVAVSYLDEGYFNHSGYALLSLLLTFRSRETSLTYKEEWVFQFSNSGLGSSTHLSGGVLQFWKYPADPSLPYLSKLIVEPNCLRNFHWEKISEEFLPDNEDISLQRLLYNPNRRVTCLISSGKTDKRFILKMVKHEDFEHFFKTAESLKKSGISEKLNMPRLLTYSRKEGLFLYHYISGLQIKKLENKKALEIKDLLFKEVVEILKTIHQTALPTLSDWHPEANENEQLESMWKALSHDSREIQQIGSRLIRPLVDRLINKFNQQRPPYPCMIHNSFSEKHILSRGEGNQFGILDWDSAVCGPREKDIGQFLSNFIEQPEACCRFIALYVSKTGDAVDEALVNHFIVCRLTLRLMRKGLKRYDLGEYYLEEIKTLADRLDA